MSPVLLFVFGALFGSFVNVLALRYDPERSIFARPAWSGRSRCPHCKKTLRWYELVPLASFILQDGRCRRCRARLSFQYPVAELISGLIFAFVPGRVALLFPYLPPQIYVLLSALWILVFLVFLLLSLIDARHQLIPDELQIIAGLAGLGLAALLARFAPDASLIGPYALIFNAEGNIWLNRLWGLLATTLPIALLVFGTRGRGMGAGDLKLALVLGIVFGWPSGLFVLFLGFVIGALFGLGGILFGHSRLKSAVAFGPFLALGGFLIFLYGQELLRGYLGLLGF